MILSNQQLNKLSEIALKAVQLAGAYINQVDRSLLKTEFKDSGSSRSSQVVTEVDLHCQAIIIDLLAPTCKQFDIALLSEENCADSSINEHARLTKDYFWCIDPLDGTLPFIEGRTGYAVSIALVNQQGRPLLSAIFIPASNDSYHTLYDDNAKCVAYKNGQGLILDNNEFTCLRFYCDQSFVKHPQYPILIKQLNALLIQLNLQSLQVISEHGAVFNALAVMQHGPAVYIKLPKPQQGGGALWDFSGTACMATAIGAWVSDIHGAALALNQADSYYMNKKGVIYASDKKLAEAVIKICQIL